MLSFAKKLLAKSKALDHALGDVVFLTPEIKGQHWRSCLEWRVKKTVNGDKYFVALRMVPDAYAGPEGSVTNYMNFDIQTAGRIRLHLDECIAAYYRLVGNKTRGAT
jgi:hypothetical protein